MKERKAKDNLPLHNIEGTAFKVDISNNVLQQVADAGNVIHFAEMEYKGDRYEFLYDREIKNVATILGYDASRMVNVSIPQKVELDPAGMAKKYGLDEKSVAGKSDFDVMVNQELYSQRINGKLPTINIAGTDFIVDLRLNEVRPQNVFHTRINLKNLDTDDNGNYQFFFRLTDYEVVKIEPTITELPKNVVMVKLPNDLELDPVAVARHYGIEGIKGWLMKFPLGDKLKAQVTPLSKTGLPEMIRKNNEPLLKKNKDNPSRKKGKHL